MHKHIKTITLGVPLAIVVAATVIPMPVRWSIGAIVFAVMVFQLSLFGAFRRLLPDTRVYVALRQETDKLIQLVRELNAITIDAKRQGADPAEYTPPVVAKLHTVVDGLPVVAGESVDGRLHLTPLAGRELHRPDEIH